MYTDQPLYRARGFEPLAGLGDVVFLLDSTGPMSKYTTPFFVVAGIEPAFGIVPHGLLILWNQGGSAPAGYGTAPGNTSLIPEAKTGNLNNGASVLITNPQILQGAPMQLVQWRFMLSMLALTGVKEHDIELQVFSPGKQSRFGIAQAAPGYVNMADAFQDPGNAIDDPAQGANKALPAAFPVMHPKDDANFREFFVWEDNGPTFQVWNNGSAAATAGSIGLRMWGVRYDLVELDPRYLADSIGVDRWLYGQVRRCPPTDRPIRVVQTSPFQAAPSKR